MKKLNLLSKAEMRKVMGGNYTVVGSCCLVGAGGLKVEVPDRENDEEYCQRLCDNAPLCSGLC